MAKRKPSPDPAKPDARRGRVRPKPEQEPLEPLDPVALIAELFPLNFAAISGDLAELDEEEELPHAAPAGADLAETLLPRLEKLLAETRLPSPDALAGIVREQVLAELAPQLAALQQAVTTVTERVNAGLAIREPLSAERLAAYFAERCRKLLREYWLLLDGGKPLPPPATDAIQLFEVLLKDAWSEGNLAGVSNRQLIEAMAEGVDLAYREEPRETAGSTLPPGSTYHSDEVPRMLSWPQIEPPSQGRPITLSHRLCHPQATQELLEGLRLDRNNRAALGYWLQARLLGLSIQELASHHNESQEMVREYVRMITSPSLHPVD